MNWFTEIRPKFELKTRNDSTVLEIVQMFAQKLSKMLGNTNLCDDYKEDKDVVFVFDTDDWHNFNKNTFSDFENRVKQLYDFAESKNLNVSVNFNEILVSEDCSSYIEMYIDDEGNVMPVVYKISE